MSYKISLLLVFFLHCFGQTTTKDYNLFIGALGKDGIVIPFASFSDSVWINRWTEPFDESEQINQPRIEFPKFWYF